MQERDQNGHKVASSSGKFMGWNTIHRIDNGAPYMTRFWIGRLRLHIFHRGDEDPDPHCHPWDFWTFPLVSYVEEVTSPLLAHALQNTDTVGCLPPDYTVKTCHVVRAWRWNFRPATHTHRVLGAFDGYNPSVSDSDFSFSFEPRVKPGKKIVTLIWRSKEYRKWGFLKNRDGKWCWVAWRDYVLGGGKDAPCE